MSVVTLGNDIAMKKIVGVRCSMNVFTFVHDHDFLRKKVGTWIKECLNSKQTVQVRDLWRDLETFSLDTFIYILGTVNLKTSPSFPLSGFVYITEQKSVGHILLPSLPPSLCPTPPERGGRAAAVSDVLHQLPKFMI